MTVANPVFAEQQERPRSELTVSAGTEIRLRLLDELSTKRSPKGTVFDLEVIDPVIVDGQVAIAAGSRAIGEVTRSDPKGAFGKAGRLEARILYLKTTGGPVRMIGHLHARGESGTTETVLTAIAAGMLAFAITGKSASLPQGTELIATLDKSMVIAIQ